jgi:hypothetical protein
MHTYMEFEKDCALDETLPAAHTTRIATASKTAKHTPVWNTLKDGLGVRDRHPQKWRQRNYFGAKCTFTHTQAHLVPHAII